mmetsp:Transcript_34166/g.69807  ORF Transcript_34166/g.69807 Transcript_34166/m.69807 type:complete len:184 (+) Transcript_34166:679-1230(+)
MNKPEQQASNTKHQLTPLFTDETDASEDDEEVKKEEKRRERKKEEKKSSSNPSFNIGDEGKRRDMIKDDDKDVALKRIAALQPDDGAFIRRTDGKWTYATVKKMESDSILFIVNPNGSSKDYKKKYWVSHVRVLNKEKEKKRSSSSAKDKDDEHRLSKKREKKEKKSSSSSGRSSRFNTSSAR